MLFNSLEFLVFLPIVFILYWFVFNKSYKSQNLFIVFASYVFYGWWDWRFLFLIALTTVLSYLSGTLIDKYRKLNDLKYNIPKIIAACNIVINLVILCIFKYFNFFSENFAELFRAFNYEIGWITLDILLPVGISFYTFQALSYTIDVYKHKLEPTKDIVSFFAFVSFFPQLVAGPIERAVHLLPQMHKSRIFSYDQALVGLNLIVYGFFKKIVVADRLAIYVDTVFTDVSQHNSITLLIAIIFFTFQIYCDFSAYSDIARGVSKFFGFELMINFSRPYLATSIREFWKKWHISLTTWFTDYVYIPLGGNRSGKTMMYRNILIVFLMSGVWHGANWTFIFWGMLHGIYLICGNIIAPIRARIRAKFSPFIRRAFSALDWLETFVLVVFAWIFFRADSMSQAFEIIKRIVSLDFSGGYEAIVVRTGGVMNLGMSILAISLLLLSYLIPENMKLKSKSTICFSIVVILVILFLSPNHDGEFIYFQF